MSLEAKLAELDAAIVDWRDLCREYPNSISYKEILDSLIVDRAKLADTIGRKTQK